MNKMGGNLSEMVGWDDEPVGTALIDEDERARDEDRDQEVGISPEDAAILHYQINSDREY